MKNKAIGCIPTVPKTENTKKQQTVRTRGSKGRAETKLNKMETRRRRTGSPHLPGKVNSNDYPFFKKKKRKLNSKTIDKKLRHLSRHKSPAAGIKKCWRRNNKQHTSCWFECEPAAPLHGRSSAE